MVNNLKELLEPCPAEDFFASVWGRTYKYVSGRAGKFAGLLPWTRLNEILEQHRLDFPRLRLARDGKSLPSSAYLRHVQSGRRKTTIPRLLPSELATQLRQGATLVLDAVDELHGPLRELAENLERTFHEHIQINAYAGWRISRGFDLHWDDHDVLILQVAGRKRWSIYGMTTPYPTARDKGSNHKPTHEPLWEGTLEDGDLLYIPRGWWHVALPLDEPTLHLTVGIHNRTGLDLMRWLADRMRASESFRQDLPRFASDMERAAYIKRLRDELMSEWTPDLLNRYFSDIDARAEARPHFSLPESATPKVLSSSSEARVRLIAPRPLELKIERQAQRKSGIVEFSCFGKRWRFAEAALSILRPLATGRACSVSELCEAAKPELDEQVVHALLSELLLHGLLAVVNDEPQER